MSEPIGKFRLSISGTPEIGTNRDDGVYKPDGPALRSGVPLCGEAVQSYHIPPK